MLITLATIAVLTLIVYFLANQVLRIAIGLKPLLVCAVCAVLISVVLPRMVVGVMGLAGTLGVIMLCAAFFAYLIAYHYDKQPAAVNETALEEAIPLTFTESEKPERSSEPSITSEASQKEFVETNSFEEEKLDSVANEAVKQAAFEEKPEESVLKRLPKDDGESTGLFAYEQQNEALLQVVMPKEAEVALPDLNDADEAETPLEMEKIVFAEDAAGQEPGESQDEQPIALTDENEAEDRTEPLLSEMILTEPVLDDPAEAVAAIASEEENVVEKEAATVDEELPENVILAAEEDLACLQVESECLAEDDIHGDGESELQANNDDWESLDVEELWDAALLHKEENRSPEALGCLRMILRKYPEDELVALAAVEAANILKNDGLYDEAIRLFSEARSLPAIQEDTAMEQEFVSAIAYLRIVKNILVQNRLGFLPFRSIPQEISQEIELEFREWRKLA